MAETKTKLTVPDLITKKQNGERVVMVAAADFLMAQWAERSGIDFIGKEEGRQSLLFFQSSMITTRASRRKLR